MNKADSDKTGNKINKIDNKIIGIGFLIEKILVISNTLREIKIKDTNRMTGGLTKPPLNRSTTKRSGLPKSTSHPLDL